MHTLIDYVHPQAPLRQPANLVASLMRLPSKPHLVPEENQLTAVIGWLCDHSTVFAQRFSALLLRDDDSFGHEALTRATAFAARTWIALPTSAGGYLWPDLEVATDASETQILVEVKVGAAPHDYLVDGDVLVQPDAYVSAWESYDQAHSGQIRRVATLTKGFRFPHSTSPMRGRDLTWTELHELLGELIDAHALEAQCVLVATDLADVIAQQVLNQTTLSPYASRLLQVAPALIKSIVTQVTAGSALTGGNKVVAKHDYAGTYLKTTFADGQWVNFWLALIPQGGRYAAIGSPDAVWLKVHEAKPAATPARFASAGLQLINDAEGYRKWAAFFPLPAAEGTIPGVAEVASDIATKIRQLVDACEPRMSARESPRA